MRRTSGGVVDGTVGRDPDGLADRKAADFEETAFDRVEPAVGGTAAGAVPRPVLRGSFRGHGGVGRIVDRAAADGHATPSAAG